MKMLLAEKTRNNRTTTHGDPMTDKPDEKPRFWETALPWQLLYLIFFVAVSVYVLVRFWQPPITWTWWVMLGSFAFVVIQAATRIARSRKRA